MIKRNIARYLSKNLNVAPEVRNHYLELPSQELVFPLKYISKLMKITHEGWASGKIGSVPEIYSNYAVEIHEELRKPILLHNIEQSRSLEAVMNNHMLVKEARKLNSENRVRICDIEKVLINPIIKSGILLGQTVISGIPIKNLGSPEILAYVLYKHPEVFDSIEEFEQKINMPKSRQALSLNNPENGEWSAKIFMDEYWRSNGTFLSTKVYELLDRKESH